MQPVPEAVKALRSEYPGKKIVFSLGRLVAYKGYRFLVEAAKYLKDDFVVLIGGSGALKEELQKEIVSLNLQEKVKLLGRVSDEELPAYYGACDVVLHEQCAENRSVWYCADRSNVVRKACGSYQNTSVRSVLGE